jgi:hypothetical protein
VPNTAREYGKFTSCSCGSGRIILDPEQALEPTLNYVCIIKKIISHLQSTNKNFSKRVPLLFNDEFDHVQVNIFFHVVLIFTGLGQDSTHLVYKENTHSEIFLLANIKLLIAFYSLTAFI